jgi:hypothetical protein
VLAPLAVAARRAAAADCGAGGEHVLGELAAAEAMPDEAWLRAVAAFGTAHARKTSGPPRDPAASPRVLALLLIVGDGS